MRAALVLPLLMCAGGTAHALPILTITVNTASVAGTNGFLDFQFDPGFNSQTATVSIANLTPSSSLGTEMLTGDATGSLFNTLTLQNTTAFNDDFVSETFPSTISFLLSFSGPAVNNPDPAFASGSTFGFGIFDANQNPILTTNPNGFAFTVNVGPGGAFQEANFTAGANLTAAAVATPEPDTAWLFLLAGSCFVCAYALRRRARIAVPLPLGVLVLVGTLTSTGRAQSVPFISDVYFSQQGAHQHSVPPGGPDLQLTITGTGFNSNSIVTWSMPGKIGIQDAEFVSLNGSCSSSTYCTATLPASYTANPTMGYVNVVNHMITPQYTIRNGNSNTIPFPVSYSVPFATVNSAPLPNCGVNGCNRPFRPSLSPAGTRPMAVATGDFDFDRLADFAIATTNSSGQGIVKVYLQTGLAGGTSTEYAAGQSPVAIAVGDFNGDGALDLAVLNEFGNGQNSTVSVFLGQFGSNGYANGQFSSKLDFGVGYRATAIVLGDFNEDGKLDIATADCGGDSGCNSGVNISTLSGVGDGTFVTGPSSNTGVVGNLEFYNLPQSLAVTDFNLDAHLDLVVVLPAQNGFLLLPGHGDGTFPKSQQRLINVPGNAPTSVAVADVNGDGYPDVAIGNSIASFIVLGPAYDTPAVISITPSDSLAFGDFNGDGTLDLATSIGNSAQIWIGNGQGGFSPTAASSAIAGPALIAADTFATGRLGVAMVDSVNSLILLEQTQPSVSLPHSLPNMYAAIGGSTSQTVTLTANSDGSAPLHISEFLNTSSTSLNSPDFQFSESNSPGCPANGGMLLPGNTCQFTVTFAPTSTAALNEWIFVLDDAIEGGSYSCTGSIFIPGSPSCQYSLLQATGVQVTLSSNNLTFPNTVVGLPAAAQQVTVTNSSGMSLMFTPTLTGNSGDFQASGSGICANFAQGFTLSTGQSCTFSIKFTPGAIGFRGASLVFRTNIVTLTLPLSGTGTAPHVDLSTTSLQLPATPATATSMFQPVTVSNMTAGALTISNIQVTGPFIGSGNCGTPVASGGSCQIQVAINPTSVGSFTGTLTFTDSVDGTTTRSVSLSGSGTNPVSQSATTFQYPATAVGSSFTETLFISNLGGASLIISNIHVAAPFAETDTCGSPVPGQGSCQILITFSPAAVGTATGALTFNDSFEGAVGRSVSLSAAGTYPVPQINLLRHCDPAVAASCVPAPTAPGGNSFTLSLAGDGFSSASTVNWKSGSQAAASLAIQSFAGRELKVTVPASLITTGGSAAITVTNPHSSATAGDGGTSSPVYLNIAPPRRGAGFTTAAAYDTDLAPTGIASGDFNGDGIPDLASASFDQNTVSILLANANGTFTSKQRLSLANAHDVAVGDFNKDGKLDIIIAQKLTGVTYGQLALFPGNGDGTFGSPVFVQVQEGPQSVQVADFNGDGKLDAVTGESGANTQFQFTAVQGNGAGGLTRASDPGPGTHPVSIAVGDYNQDGIPDVAVVIQPFPTGNGSSGAPGSVAILLGNGDFTFRGVASYPTGAQPQGIAAGDFNGDGKLDLAVANEFENTVSILLGNGDGSFQGPAKAAVASFPFSLTAADFSGDGIADLAVAACGDMESGFLFGSCRSGSGAVSILISNGDGTFQTHADFGTPSAGTPLAITAGDFNNDGVEDIAVTSFESGGVRVLLQTVPPATDVTSQVQVSSSGFLLNRAAHTYNGTVTIINSSSQTIAGPISLVLRNLPSGVSLVDGTGETNGNPYIVVPGVTSLTPGQQATVTVAFSNPANTMITFMPAVWSSAI